MTGHDITRRLAAFAADLDRLPEDIEVLLGDLFLDYLRVASIGESMPWSTWARDYAMRVAREGEATVLFSPVRLNPLHAAFLNTTYAGSIDSDDTHVGSMLHPGSIVFSAALAVGESCKASGAEFVAAVAAGYEAMIRIGLAIQPSHFGRGFQSTATCGGFGAAVAATRLLLRDETRIAEALGIVASFSSGLTQFYKSGSTVKRIHAAHAAESGVSAALLVREGFSGPTDILEGENGFARAYADACDFSIIEDGLGDTFRLREVLVKGHACSARLQSAVEAMLDLRLAHGFGINDIASVRVGIPRIIQGRLTIPKPVDLQAAQMSVPYATALAAAVPTVTAGTVLTMRDFDEGLRSEPVRALQDRMEIALDDDVEATSSDKSVSAKVTVRLHSGERFEAFVKAPKGSPTRPYTSAEHIERFKAELSGRIGQDDCRALVDISRDLPRLELAAIVRLLGRAA